MNRKATAVWLGKEAKGTISTQSGVLKAAQYSLGSRFETGAGTNPEELIAAAHAGCFAMALSVQLGTVGLTAESITTDATVALEKLEGGWTVTGIHLDVKCKLPGVDKTKFDAAAESAKTGCPISRLLAPGTKITMTAALI